MRSDTATDFESETRLPRCGRTLQDHEASLPQKSGYLVRVGGGENMRMRCLEASLPSTQRGSFVPAPVLMKEEVQEVADDEGGVSMTGQNCCGRVDDMRMGFLRCVDDRPVVSDRVRNPSPEVQEIGLDPQAPGVYPRERPQSARVTREVDRDLVEL
jgi:hypothetical protein